MRASSTNISVSATGAARLLLRARSGNTRITPVSAPKASEPSRRATEAPREKARLRKPSASANIRDWPVSGSNR